MPKGLPISYIKKWGISKLAWKKFRAGALTKGVPTRTFPKKKGSSKGVKSMARRRRYFPRRRSRRGGMTIPVAPIVGLAIGMAEPVQIGMAGNWMGAVKKMGENYLGIDYGTGQWKWEHMAKGLAPLVIGLLVHKFVGGRPLNFNAALGRAKVPFIRI